MKLEAALILAVSGYAAAYPTTPSYTPAHFEPYEITPARYQRIGPGRLNIPPTHDHLLKTRSAPAPVEERAASSNIEIHGVTMPGDRLPIDQSTAREVTYFADADEVDQSRYERLGPGHLDLPGGPALRPFNAAERGHGPVVQIDPHDGPMISTNEARAAEIEKRREKDYTFGPFTGRTGLHPGGDIEKRGPRRHPKEYTYDPGTGRTYLHPGGEISKRKDNDERDEPDKGASTAISAADHRGQSADSKDVELTKRKPQV